MPGITDDLQGLARRLVEPLSGWFIPWNRYTTGTWTPAVQGTTTPGAFTYAYAVGNWTRLANLVFLNGAFQVATVPGAPAGNLAITGLPFAVASEAGAQLYFTINIGGAAATVTNVGFFDPGQTRLRVIQNFQNAPATFLPATAVAANFAISLSGWYFAS